jgi:hypothetical protein
MPIGPPWYNKCKDCGGTGEIEGEFHLICLGTGLRGWAARHTYQIEAHADILDKINDIKEKVDEIKVVVDAL